MRAGATRDRGGGAGRPLPHTLPPRPRTRPYARCRDHGTGRCRAPLPERPLGIRRCRQGAKAKEIAAAYPENNTRPVDAQGAAFGVGRTVMPGDKDYNRVHSPAKAGSTPAGGVVAKRSFPLHKVPPCSSPARWSC